MLNKHKIINFFIYSYIALPFIIFAAGFLRWYFALPAVIITLTALFLSASDSESKFSILFKKTDIMKIVAGLIFITVLVILSGIGNIAWQNNDHSTRNTLFNILVNETWPPKATVKGEGVGLVYYIGFWLPSALVGKLLSLEAGYIFSIIWAVLGLSIIWLLLCIIHKKIVFYPLFIFLFFSGLDIVGHWIMTVSMDKLSVMQKGIWAFPKGSELTTHLEWWASRYQFSSHITQLFWVFNQCIPVWIATLVIILEKNNKNLVFIMGLTLLSSTLPFIGLVPVFLWCAFTNHSAPLLDRPFTDNVKKSFLSLFTFQNFFGGGVSGLLTFIYLKSNIATNSSSSAQSSAAAKTVFSLPLFFIVIIVWLLFFFIFTTPKKKSDFLYLIPLLPFSYLISTLTPARVGFYLLFIVFDLLIVALISFPKYRHSALYFITISCLLIIPFFKIGRSIDFCMRVSIPLLVILCLFLIDSVKEYTKDKNIPMIVISSVIITLGCITPIHEIVRTLEASAYEIETKGEVINDNQPVEKVFKSKNFTGKLKDNLFFEKFAK